MFVSLLSLSVAPRSVLEGGLYYAMSSRKSKELCPQQKGASRTNVLVPSPGRLSSVFKDSPKPFVKHPFVEEASGS